MIDGKQKLSRAMAREICDKYFNRIRIRQKDLAKVYGVSQSTVARIVAGYELKK